MQVINSDEYFYISLTLVKKTWIRHCMVGKGKKF